MDFQGWVVNDIYDMEKIVGDVYNLSTSGLDDELKNQTFSSIWEPYFGNAFML
jgi:hypothetical protein